MYRSFGKLNVGREGQHRTRLTRHDQTNVVVIHAASVVNTVYKGASICSFEHKIGTQHERFMRGSLRMSQKLATLHYTKSITLAG